MGYISSTLVLRTHALLTLYAAHLLLTSPITLLHQNLILFLGSSMRLPDPAPSTFGKTPTSATGFAALVLIILAISDLAATTLPVFAYDEFWSVMAPTRTVVFMGLAGWVYVNGRGLDEDGLGSLGLGREKRYGGELVNGLVFSWAFVEMSLMFWVFIVLRDERKQTAAKIMEERQQKEDRL